MPFSHAADQLEAILGVHVSVSTVRRLTEEAGKLCEQEQDELPQQAYRTSEEEPVNTPLVMSADGAMVHIRGNGWQEVKTLMIAKVQERPSRTRKHVKRTSEHTVFSRLADAATFSDLCSGEISRRGIDRAEDVCAVQDGALWLQGFVDGHRHDAVRILDFSHASSYISAIGEEISSLGGHLPKEWLGRILHRLKHDGPRLVLRYLNWLVKRFGSTPTLQNNLSYLLKREEHMQYPDYLAAGWPIGSGMVESAHKRVLQARLKGAGMQWLAPNVNAMLALRIMIDNDRWDQEWQERRDLQHRQRHQRALTRQARQHQKAEETLKPILIRVLLMQASCQLAAQREVPLVVAPPPTPQPRRSAFNPWRGDPSKAFSLQAKK